MPYDFIEKVKIQNNFTVSIPKEVRDILKRKTGKEIKAGMYMIWMYDPKKDDLKFSFDTKVKVE